MSKDKKKKDYLSYTLIFQFVVCVILFGTVWGFKQLNSEIYLNLESLFYNNLEKNFNFIQKNTEKKDTPVDSVVSENTEEQPSEKEETTVFEKQEQQSAVEIIPAPESRKNSPGDTDIPDNVSVNGYTLNDKMVLPLKGEITSPFGMRNHPITNELSFHAGIDIAAAEGTPIYASFDGQVVFSGYDRWNGNYLKIMHRSEIMTVYCHCKTLTVEKGDFVKAGDIIAYVGSTGSSTGPHLHFEFRIANISYDPQTALEEAISAV